MRTSRVPTTISIVSRYAPQNTVSSVCDLAVSNLTPSVSLEKPPDDRLKNLRPRRNIRTAMNNEILMFAAAQKEDKGMDKVVEEAKYRM